MPLLSGILALQNFEEADLTQGTQRTDEVSSNASIGAKFGAS
jgi:hypothetical protein